ncbi:MAG: leucine-rich repeat domain-containing protein [Muribaculaceae bacterium]|nr:leucine-rich repeat domain-containing protein [Muribaculaceae bacterium]
MRKILTLNRFASTVLLLIGGVFLGYSGFVIDQLQYAPMAERPGEVSVGMEPALFNTNGEFSFDVPDSVTSPDDGMKYVVTTVRTGAFYGAGYWDEYGREFTWNRRILKVTLPSTVTRIESDAFNTEDYPAYGSIPYGVDTLEINCARLTRLFEYAFRRCNFKEFNFNLLPDNIDSIGTSVFHGNVRLEKVEWPEYLTEIPDWMFYWNRRLKSLKLPPTLKKIGQSAFGDCYLDTLTIPSGVEIGRKAFEGNMDLKELTLGEDCILGSGAFIGCGRLTHVTLPRGTRFITDPYPGNIFGYWRNSYGRIDIDRDVIFDVPDIRLICMEVIGEEGFDVYYHTSTPQETESAKLFSDTIYKDGILYVEGEEGVKNARNTFPWNKFVNILPIEGTADPSGVAEAGLSDNESVSEVYSLDGIRLSKKISELGPGCYIVRKGSKVNKIVVN